MPTMHRYLRPWYYVLTVWAIATALHYGLALGAFELGREPLRRLFPLTPSTPGSIAAPDLVLYWLTYILFWYAPLWGAGWTLVILWIVEHRSRRVVRCSHCSRHVRARSGDMCRHCGVALHICDCCGYDLYGCTAARCPECGSPLCGPKSRKGKT